MFYVINFTIIYVFINILNFLDIFGNFFFVNNFFIFYVFVLYFFNFFFSYFYKITDFNRNIDLDLSLKFFWFFFKNFSFLFNFVKVNLLKVFFFLKNYKYFLFLKTIELSFKKYYNLFSIYWRPLFKKTSYFGYFRSNRSKWIK